jgi:hypothetical protein
MEFKIYTKYGPHTSSSAYIQIPSPICGPPLTNTPTTGAPTIADKENMPKTGPTISSVMPLFAA